MKLKPDDIIREGDRINYKDGSYSLAMKMDFVGKPVSYALTTHNIFYVTRPDAMQYKLVTSSNKDDLSDKVCELLADDWKPYEGHTATYMYEYEDRIGTHYVIMYAQALTKEAE